RNDGIFEQERYRLHDDALDAGMQHRLCQRDGELLEKVRVGFRYGQAGTEARDHRIVASNNLFQFAAIEQISLPDRDTVAKRREPVRRADKGGYGMSVPGGLADNLQPGTAGSTEHKQFHTVLRFRTPVSSKATIDIVSHIRYRCI